MFPDRVESRSRAPVRGNYTLLLLVHRWGKRGIAGEEAIVLISASFHRCRVIALRSYLLSPCICLFPLFSSRFTSSVIFHAYTQSGSILSLTRYTSVRLLVDTITHVERTRRPEKIVSRDLLYRRKSSVSDWVRWSIAKLYSPITFIRHLGRVFLSPPALAYVTRHIIVCSITL